MYFTGIIIAICTFLTIGIWHPIVIKTEYHWGTRPWIVYLIIGLVCIIAALFVENTIVSAIIGVFIDKDETLCPIHHGKSIYAIEEDDENTADTSR